MPALAALTTFSAGVIQRSPMNGNFAALRTWADNSVVLTDVAKTISANHTFTNGPTFSGEPTFAGGMAITSGAGPTSVTANTAKIGAGGSNPRAGTIAFGDGSGWEFQFGPVIAGTFTPRVKIVDTGDLVLTAAASQIVPGATSLSLRNNADAADNVLVTDAGAMTVRAGVTVTAGGLTVSAGGLTVEGTSSFDDNVTIGGNLTVTGTLSGAVGSNSYVRRATDLNFTTGTDLTLTFAIGATEEWEFAFVLAHTNGSAATASFLVNGPVSSTGFFGGISTVNGTPGTVQGDAEILIGNAIGSITMSSAAGYTEIRGYIKGGGSAGNVTLAGTASAGTGVLKAGSFVRYARIA